MSRLSDLLKQVARLDPALGADLGREVKALEQRRPFGLNFERHQPEAVELPSRPVMRSDTVRVLPPRGSGERGDATLWQVQRVVGGTAKLARVAEGGEIERAEHPADDLVVVAEFRDPIYPGLVSTGRVERGGDKPFHTVINAENFHALEALTYTHEGKVDAIYIDPPYNTGAKDWKYNNDYVDGEDAYRHSKWLAFMERRLKLAKRLLNPENSVLIVTIDEREGRRLGLLLEQTFPEARVQMVSSVINPKGVPKAKEFSRVDEWIFFVMVGDSGPSRWVTDMWSEFAANANSAVRYVNLKREGSNWQRSARPGLFYPIYADPQSGQILEFGSPLPADLAREEVRGKPGLLTVWPLKPDGSEARWQQKPESAAALRKAGYLRSRLTRDGGITIEYLSSGQQKFVENGVLRAVGRDENGALIVEAGSGLTQIPKTMWRQVSHSATDHGSKLLSMVLGGRRFPFPKSLYAVEDTLRFFVADKPDAVVLDFFSGSGTTAHAVMRLNKQDGGRRQCISVTNNEVSADEQKKLRAEGFRPGDAEWEQWGICDYITKPRIRAAITGKTPDGDPIKGDYKFTDEFPMADGFEENAEFFTLTYEAPRSVAHHYAFEAIAPLLWLRAGARGRRIDKPLDTYDVAEAYGVLFNVDATDDFVSTLVSTGATAEGPRMAFVVTDDERAFQYVCAQLPESIEPVRLYESYLTSFTIGVNE